MSEEPKEYATRDGFGEGIVEAARADERVVVLTADLKDSLKLTAFAKEFPTRFIECGVAEQNMMGIAAGLAHSGKIPFVCSYAVFSPGRNWDQLRVSVCYSQANVKIIGGHTGLSVGADGATHQGLEDIAITRVLPNLTVVVPADSGESKKATLAIAQYSGPCYVRLTREKSPSIVTTESIFTIGKANVLRQGSDVTIIGCGPLLAEVLKAARVLEKEGIHAEVVNNHTIKPLDSETILTSVKKTKRVVTIEDHQIMGGMGSSVCELLSQEYPVPVHRMGMQDSFGESGTPQELYTKYGLTSEAIAQRVKDILV
ncbi:MAG: transketolase family protein [Candidatus Woesebacteria bacterium]